MPVRIERNGPVFTVVMSRPEAKNAVDRHTAQELSEAFLQFEREPEAKVAVLFGDHGAFCSGADLKAVARGELLRIDPDGDGPLGPSRRVLSKPSIAAVAGHAVAGGLELAL